MKIKNCKIDIESKNINTDSDLNGSGLVMKDVRKVWMQAVRAEVQLDLLLKLKGRNLGLAQVENFLAEEAKKRKSEKFNKLSTII